MRGRRPRVLPVAGSIFHSSAVLAFDPRGEAIFAYNIGVVETMVIVREALVSATYRSLRLSFSGATIMA